MSALSSFRNITADVKNPQTRTDFTALVILDTLRKDPHGEVFSTDVKKAVLKDKRARVSDIGRAKKALRNMGYAFYVAKHRDLSFYVLAARPEQFAEFCDRVTSETYSQTITAVRQMHTVLANNPNDPLIQAAHQNLQNTAIALGQRCGLTVPEVVAELQPL